MVIGEDNILPEDDKSIRFVNEWLSVIADYITGLLISQIVKVKSLSTRACYQIGADITYLM